MNADGVATLVGLAGAVLAFVLSTTQSLISAKAGSDHSVHAFLAEGIRRNGHKLYVTVPRLLNTCHCAALPLYLHWVMSHFSTSALYWLERLLNPFVNALHVMAFVVLALIATRLEGLSVTWLGLTICAFALTPQFFHALSARNFGLSARSIGLLLLTLFFLAAWKAEVGRNPSVSWAALIVLGWLVWGFSTFAQQAMCLVSVLLFVITGRTAPLIGTLLGLALFIALHSRYSLSYLRHTLRFIGVYASELAPVYILNRRKSIWRDLIWDIWVRFGDGLRAGLHYAYENSLLVVLLLNPMTILACWAAISAARPGESFIGYCGFVSLSGALAMVLTSFRPTRFLGEPERYVEAVSPWAVISGAFMLQTAGGIASLVGIVVVFALFNLVQLFASKVLLNYVSEFSFALEEIEGAIRSQLGGNVRFSSNNEHFTKMLMKNTWQFAYCLAAGQDYAGLKMHEVFSTFPFVKRGACERIVSTYRINACLLDRRLYESLFDERPAPLRHITIAYESPRFRLLIFDWADAPGAVT